MNQYPVSLPEDWEWISLKYLCNISNDYGINLGSDSYTSQGVRLIRTTDIDSGELSGENPVYLDKEANINKHLEYDDILLSRSGTVGESYIHNSKTEQQYTFASYLVRYRIQNEFCPKFVYYYTNSKIFDYFVKSEKRGSTISNISGRRFGEFPVPVPPKKTAEQIVAFLEKYLKKYSDVLNKLTELEQINSEKRKSEILKAVNGHPDILRSTKVSELKDAVKLPQNWNIVELKYILEDLIDSEHSTPPKNEEGEYKIIKTQNVKDGKIISEQCENTGKKTYEEWTTRGEPRSGDLVVTREAPAGRVGIVDDEYQYLLGQRTVLLKPDSERVTTEYLNIYLQSLMFDWWSSLKSQGSTVDHVNISDLKDLPVVLPPQTEQHEIARETSETLGRLTDLEDKRTKLAKLVEEKRKSLVTAAVTGQIDVSEERGVIQGDD